MVTVVTVVTVLIGIAVILILRYRLLDAGGSWEGDPSGAIVERWRRRREGIAKTLADLESDRDAGRTIAAEHESLRSACERRLEETDAMVEGLRRARYDLLVARGLPAGGELHVSEETRARVEARVKERKEAALKGVPIAQKA
jgi:hypothetical protein